MSISEHIIEKLSKNDPSLKELNLGGSAIDNKTLETLAKALERNNVLQNLELGNNNIDGEGAEILAKILMGKNAIQTAYLRGNKIGDRGAKALAQALKQNDVLLHLYLGGNEITVAGVKDFAEALTKNSTLETIYLRNNNVTDEGAKILAQSLIRNFGLRVLNLANSAITIDGCRDLIAVLDLNTSLQSIVFEHNGVEDAEIAKAFSDRFKYNSSIEVITSNAVVKKILLHCEKYLELEKVRSDKREMSLEQLSEKYSLTRSEQYHWSGVNLQGNAILCSAIFARFVAEKYPDKAVYDEIIRVFKLFYSPMMLRAKQDLDNAKVTKPNPHLLQIAANFSASF